MGQSSIECRRVYRAANRERINAQERARYAANPEKFVAKTMAWKRRNPARHTQNSINSAHRHRERHNAQCCLYAKTHRDVLTKNTAAYRARKLQATPLWLTPDDHEDIAQWYRLGASLQMAVDHIVPLKGKNVCGLHVPWNLRLLPPRENSQKSNYLDETLALE